MNPRKFLTLYQMAKKTESKKVLIQRIERIFKEKLQLKTGWGRNEVLTAFRNSVNEALLELMDAKD